MSLIFFFFGFLKNLVVNLPASFSLTLFWNFGRILGMVLVFQIFTGVFLAFYFSPDGLLAFRSVQYIINDVSFGWLFRIFHFNGASLFFIFLYLHFFKGLFIFSYRLSGVWFTGLRIFLFVMMEAFIGYVLVWAQMSFWASVVITRLLSVIPYFGFSLVYWIWGGFSVVGSTLKFFFVLHFLLPWFIFVVILVHLFFLHRTGSTSSLYCHGDYDKVCFFPFYFYKDSYNLLFFFLFFFFVFSFPFVLGDPEMFIECDPLVSPVHIVPEWYFLFAYAILRAIPDKSLGVFLLLIRIVIFYFFPFSLKYLSPLDALNDFLVVFFILVSVFLSWLGQCHVEYPFVDLRVYFSVLYFLILFFIMFINYFYYYIFC